MHFIFYQKTSLWRLLKVNVIMTNQKQRRSISSKIQRKRRTTNLKKNETQ